MGGVADYGVWRSAANAWRGGGGASASAGGRGRLPCELPQGAGARRGRRRRVPEGCKGTAGLLAARTACGPPHRRPFGRAVGPARAGPQRRPPPLKFSPRALRGLTGFMPVSRNVASVVLPLATVQPMLAVEAPCITVAPALSALRWRQYWGVGLRLGSLLRLLCAGGSALSAEHLTPHCEACSTHVG